MKKTYVIDTNILIQSPYAIECFEDNDLVIPLVVVEELDGLKKADGEKGANARQAVRLLENYRNKGNLLIGVQLQGGVRFLYRMHYLRDLKRRELMSAKPFRLMKMARP